MKLFLTIIALLALSSCSMPAENESEKSDASVQPDSTVVETEVSVKEYGNERFRNVSVQKVMDSIMVSGEARVFEATFLYEVYRNQQVVKDSFITASAGGPEWGSFKFSVKTPDAEPNDSLFIRVYESSAKDGSPLGILHIPVE